MSNWFLIALIAPVLWSIVNHLDKYMLSKYLKDKGVGALLIFSAVSSIIILPFIGYIFRSEIFQISGGDLITLVFIGFLSAGAFYFYLSSMEKEEASVVDFGRIFNYITNFRFPPHNVRNCNTYSRNRRGEQHKHKNWNFDFCCPFFVSVCVTRYFI